MLDSFSRLAFIVSVTTCITIGAPANSPLLAADLFIAGTIGVVYKGDSVTGGFTPFAATCLAPIQALALDDANIYAGDLTGAVLRFDLTTGTFMNGFCVGPVSAMVMDGPDLLISEPSGTILRVNPMTGAVQSTLTSPIFVEAMLLIGSDLYVTGPTGDVWKGDAQTGGFTYFGCACSGIAQAMAHDGTSLFVGDNFGAFLRYDLANGWLMWEGFLPFDVTAMVMEGDDLLISDSNQNVHRIDPYTVVVLNTLTSPINIEAMQMPAQVPIVGDIDGDGDVDSDDLVAIVAVLLDSPLDPAHVTNSDLNGDGAADGEDIQPFAVVLLTS